MPPTEEDLAWFRSTFRPIPKATLPDDCVEYSLYLISPDIDASKDFEARLRLRDIQRHASNLQRQWLKDYIWQRQGFGLELVKEDGVSLLRGRTEYGDSAEDEWVVVWLLREISKKFSDLWVKITDNDGEFLLIEASGTIPGWLEPEIAENRVWIHDGSLAIIKPANTARTSKRTSEILSLNDARNTILTNAQRLMHSSMVEEEAFYRIRNYPDKIKENMHHALMTIPRKVAFLLRQKPAYIAPATEAFYLRDPIALKPLQSAKSNDALTFPPNDLVTLSVTLPRIGYAQIRSQEFPPPPAWKAVLLPKTDSKEYLRIDSGMKASCGFEMLLSDPHHQDNAAVREMKMLLGDVDTGDEKLPTDDEIKQWSMKADDESWLDISFDDLETELGGKEKKKESQGKKKPEFGDKAAQENLQRIVKQFESFLGDENAGVDGAGMFDEDSDDDLDNSDESDDELEHESGEDKEASFNEDDFTKMMREMMGMPAGVMDELMNGKTGSMRSGISKQAASNDPGSASDKLRVVEMDSDDEEDGEEDLQTLTHRMEAELKRAGALDLSSGISKEGATQRAVHGKQPKPTDGDVSSEDSHDGENDIDINLIKNLLESFKSQAGMPGPGGNMLGALGLGLPRDER